MSATSIARRPTSRVSLLAAALVVALGTLPAGAAAQTGPGTLSGEVAALGATLAGSDFDNVGPGAGGELGLRYGLTRRISLGLDAQGSWHDASGLDGSLRLLGLALAPRYAFGSPSASLRPFVELRAGVARWNASRSADSVSARVSADGLRAGGAAGVSYSLADAATLEVAAVASYLTFGDAEVDATLGGRSLPPFQRQDSETTGSLLALRTLLRFPIP